MTPRDSTVLLLQHAEKRREPGNPGLTATGRVQASTSAAFLARLAPTQLISSPLLRAQETIAPLAHLTGLPVTTDDRLRERMNLEPDDTPEQFFTDWTHTLTDRSYQPHHGRSSAQTGQDMLAALDAINQHGVVAVLAVHGGATIDLLRTLLGDNELEARSAGLIRQGVPGAAITTLTGNPGAWGVADIASLAHLAPDQITGHAR